MEVRPTLDKSIVVRPSRPGWKAALVVAAFFLGIYSVISVMGV